MKIHDVVQGTPQWRALRIGIPTASNMERVLNDGTKRGKDKVDSYACLIAAERHLKREIVKFKGNYYTERGKELEPEALSLYEMRHNCDCKHVGFITNDNGTAGCSPDFVVNEIEGGELKCPEADTHISYLCDGVLPSEYKVQVQSSLFLTGWKVWHFMSHYPDLPPFEIDVLPDQEFHEKLQKDLDAFEIIVQHKLRKIKGE